MTMQKTAKGFLRGLAAVMAAALAATALSGCQSGEGGGASEPTEVVKVGLLPELELGSRQMTVLSQSSGEDLKELDEDMKELYGLEIEFISVQWASLGEKTTQLVLGGTPPDIYYSRMRDFPLLPKKNILQPLDEILDFSLPIYAGTEEVRKDTMYNGQTYASCTQASVPNVMWYNEKLFREAALDTPRQYLERDEWNWNTMLTLAQELTDEAEGRYGLAMGRNTDLRMTTGKDVIMFDEQGNPQQQLNDKDILATMDFWNELGLGRYKVMSPELNPTELFKQGKIGMMVGGSYLVSQFADMSQSNEVNFVPFPKYPDADDYYNWGTYTSLSIPRGAQNINAARAFIYAFQYMSSAYYVDISDDEFLTQRVAQEKEKKTANYGYDEEDFAMEEFMRTNVKCNLNPAERVNGYTDYFDWVVAQTVRNEGTAYQTVLAEHEPWLQDFVDTYNKEVLGISE